MTHLANAWRDTLSAAAAIWMPPPPVDLEQWAVENIVIAEGDFPGPYNKGLFPFWSEPLKAMGPDDPCRIISIHGSAQLGKTILANVFTLGYQALDPGPMLYVHPTEENARRWSNTKLKPMLRDVKALRGAFPERSRDGGDSILYKERSDGRGFILISGANSPASLSLVSIDRQVQDDLSKWVMNNAGDPEQQADSRSRGRQSAKIAKIGTPLVMPGCKITKNFMDGSQEYFEVPCPHCQFQHVLEWGNMLTNLDEAHPEKAHFTCPDCGGVIEQHHRQAMVSAGRWVARNPQAMRYHRSFHLWSAYGPIQYWELIAREWLRVKGDPAGEKVFLNDSVGEAYQEKGEAPPWEKLRDRAALSELPRGIVPAWGVILTMGMDCQKDRVEWQLIAWGREFRRHVVEYGVVPGHISETDTRARLRALVESQTWQHAHGRKLGVDLAAIDGNAWTEEVWGFAREVPAAKLIMVRGVGNENAPLIARVQKEYGRNGKRKPYSKRFYNFATSVLKMALYRNLAKEDVAERNYIGFARGLEDEYFRQLTAERRVAVKRKDGFIDHRWVKDDNQANEALDTMLQAEACAAKLQLKSMPDKIWDKLEEERCSPPVDAQMDIEDMGLALPTAQKPAARTASETQPVQRPGKPAARPRRGGFVQRW